MFSNTIVYFIIIRINISKNDLNAECSSRLNYSQLYIFRKF